MTENKEDKKKQVMVFLAWQDCLERLNTLLQEIRHLQVNIIYYLREPIFYHALIYEESFLWGGRQSREGDTHHDFLDQFDDGNCGEKFDGKPKAPGYWNQYLQDMTVEDFRLYAAAWTLPYPWIDSGSGRDRSEAYTKLLEKLELEYKKNMFDKMNTRLMDILENGGWNAAQKQSYHSLRGLQVLKRNILKDKISLCYWGGLAFKLFSTPKIRVLHSGHYHAHFMLVRSTIMARANDYVNRLSDHQSQFGKLLDAGHQDHPRPVLERSREQGIYSDFQADRTRDLNREINHYLDFMKVIDRNAARKVGPRLSMHRWNHTYTSRTATFVDEVGDYGESESVTSINYVTTSYWMPDRPDLQSLIAHEVAHSVLKERYDDLRPQTLNLGTDAFSILLREMHTCISLFFTGRAIAESVPGNLRTVYLMREISSDLMATAVQGHAYLYSLFLEHVGNGLEYLFVEPNGKFALESAHDTTEVADENPFLAREWFIRLFVITHWLNAIHHHAAKDYGRRSSLDNIVTQGIEHVLDNLMDYLDGLTSKRGSKLFWTSLAGRLGRIIGKSDAAARTRLWREKRSRDDRDYDGKKGSREMPRFSRRLDWRLRDYMFRVLVHDKLGGKCETPEEEFGRIYQIKSYKLGTPFRSHGTFGKRKANFDEKTLFQHIYDVPWQMAVLLGLDFSRHRQEPAKEPHADWVGALHNQSTTANKLYQVALNFYIYDIRSAYHRLSDSRRFVDEYMKHLQSKGKEESHPKNSAREKLIEELKNWMGNDNRDPGWVTEAVTDIKGGRVKKLASRYPANILVQAYLSQNDESLKRKIGRVHGHKLVQLYELIKDCNDEFLVPLISFLSIRENTQTAPPGDEFYLSLLGSLSEGKFKSGTSDPIAQSFYVLERISTAGSYDRSKYVMRPRDAWRYEINGRGSDRKMQMLLGRYDWLRQLQLGENFHRGDVPVFIIKGHADYTEDAKAGGSDGKRVPAPAFEENTENQEVDYHYGERTPLPSYFVRREYAIPVRLGKHNDGSTKAWDNIKEKKIVALIAVNLMQRCDRLSFLYRLLKGIKGGGKGHIEQLEGICTLFDVDDRAFITDGWGDILLVFSGVVDRLGDIFDIQNALYQDFQVDRTELILAPECLDHAAKNWDRDGKPVNNHIFRISAHIRLMEDRQLNRGNEEFLRKIAEKTSGNAKIFCCNRSKQADDEIGVVKSPVYTVTRTPGRTDFSFRFSHRLGQDDSSSLQSALVELFDIENVDRVQTNIGIIRDVRLDGKKSPLGGGPGDGTGNDTGQYNNPEKS